MYQDRSQRGPSHGRGSGNYHKRGRKSSFPGLPQQERSTEDDLKDLIVRVFDRGNFSDILGLSELLYEELESFTQVIMDSIFECVKALPHKTSIYAALTSILLSKKEEIANVFYNRLKKEFKNAFLNRKFYDIKFLVRFAIELQNVNVLSVDTVINLLTNLLKYIIPENKKNFDDNSFPYQHIGDFYIGIILTSIVMCKNKTVLTEEMHQLIKRYMELRYPINIQLQKDDITIFDEDIEEDIVALLDFEKKFVGKDWLERLYICFEDYISKDWPPLESVHKPWEDEAIVKECSFQPTNENLSLFEDEDEAISDLVTFKKYYESVNINEDRFKNSVSCIFTFPKPYYRLLPIDLSLYGSKKSGESHILLPIEKCILDDYVQDILHFFSPSIRDAVAILLSLPFKFDFIDAFLCESIFSEMLRLPFSAYSTIFYGVIIAELCKKLPETFPSFLGETINRIFKNAHKFETRALVVFIDWFSFHLSNFEFKWDWEKWKEYIENDKPTSQYIIIQETLQKCLRLSYYERIKETVPEDFLKLLPKPTTPNPFNKSENSDENSFILSQSSIELYRMMESSFSNEDILNKINDAIEEKSLTESQVIHVITRAILVLGSKSISSLQSSLDKFQPLIRKLCYKDGNAEDNESCITNAHEILSAVWEHYENSTQHLVISFLKIVHNNIVTAKISSQFILNPDRIKRYGHRLYLWEILDQIIRAILEKVKLNVIELQKRKSESESDNKDKEMTDESANDNENSISELNKEFETNLKELNELFRVVLDRFNSILNDAIKENESIIEDEEVENYWFKITLGNLRSITRKYFVYAKDVSSYVSDLIQNSDPRIEEIYKEFIFLSNQFT